MLSAKEALQSILDDYRAMRAHEGNEAALSTNKPWITASKTKIKRDAPDHIPIEGDHPETFASLTAITLHHVARVVKARRVRMEQGSNTFKAPQGSKEWEEKRAAVLSEKNVSAIEVAFLYDYTSDRPVREMRIRNGLDENTGRVLKDSQRPIISNRKRARQ